MFVFLNKCFVNTRFHVLFRFDQSYSQALQVTTSRYKGKSPYILLSIGGFQYGVCTFNLTTSSAVTVPW